MFSLYHNLYIVATVVFLVVGVLVMGKLPRWAQNIVFLALVIVGSGGVFYRYALNLGDGSFNLKRLLIQMLQVCNFNFVLLPLCLVPRFKIARDYLYYFSMFAACTVFLTYGPRIVQYGWDSPIVVNFWINHVCVVAFGLFLPASGRYLPTRKNIPIVSILVVAYFVVSFLGSTYLIKVEGWKVEDTFSFVYTPEGNPVFEMLYKWIPVPLAYLLPLVPFLVGWFYLVEFVSRKCYGKRYQG